MSGDPVPGRSAARGRPGRPPVDARGAGERGADSRGAGERGAGDRGRAERVDLEAAAVVFEAERPRLVGLAYRLLGSLSDAEDVVQEAWLRWAGADRAAVDNPAAWLTTVTSRIGLDRLRARSRERASYVGPWLPEPLVEPLDLAAAEEPAVTADVRPSVDPADRAALADSLTTAFLVLLEELSPVERLVILLVDVFGEPFRLAAEVTGRSEAAVRQLAVRARRKLRATTATDVSDAEAVVRPAVLLASGLDLGGRRGEGVDRPARVPVDGAVALGDGGGEGRPPVDPDGDLAAVPRRRRDAASPEAVRVATTLLGAVATGDLDAAMALLAPEVVLVSDGGADHHAARRPVLGADRVARLLVNLAKRVPEGAELVPGLVNGEPGVVVRHQGRTRFVLAIGVDPTGVVDHVSVVVNPDKLQAVDDPPPVR